MKHCIRTFFLSTLLIVLAACGGGESLERVAPSNPDPSQGPNSDTLSIRLALIDSAGSPSTDLSESSPLTLQATVTNQTGAVVPSKVVRFVIDQAGLATFNNDTGTALTNDQGVATIVLSVGELSGSGVITASVDDSFSATIGFTSAGASASMPAELDLLSSSASLASSGNERVELIAVVRDERNVLLSGVPISFSVNQNAALSNVDAQTGPDGTARALLSTQNDPENRTINVIARAQGANGVLEENLDITVTGTTLSISTSSSIIINDSSPVSIILADSNGNGLANREISISASNGVLSQNGLSISGSATTNNQGAVNLDFTATGSGIATIEASALGTSDSFTVSVQQDDFSFSSVPSEDIEIGQNANIELRWFKDNQAFANGDIIVTASRGVIEVNGVVTGNVQTNANGLATVSIRSDFAGPSSISAIGTDNQGNTVTARTQVEFVARIPDSISVDATPDLIGPDGQTSTITAIVRDASGNLVKGQVVDFTIISDSTGGQISPNNAVTNNSGIATTVYTSNAVSSDDGILIRASSGSAQGDTTLTVGDRAFDISLGTGNVIQEADNSTYLKEFAVFVTDAAGRPVSDAELTVSASPPLTETYRKGFWEWNDVDNIHYPVIVATCNSEDVNRNNRLDAGEDRNGDGELTPGNVVSVRFKDNITRTNEFGQATIEVRYAKQFGVWSTIELKVSGQSLGTESEESQTYRLDVATADLQIEGSPPPSSPFGIDSVCESPN